MSLSSLTLASGSRSDETRDNRSCAPMGEGGVSQPQRRARDCVGLKRLGGTAATAWGLLRNQSIVAYDMRGRGFGGVRGWHLDRRRVA